MRILIVTLLLLFEFPTLGFSHSRTFDGVDDTIAIADGASVRAQRPMAVGAWLKKDSASEQDTILNKRGGTNDDWAMFSSATSGIQLTFFGIADTSVTTPTWDTNWHYVVVTISSGGTVTFYSDGSSEGTASINAPVTSTATLHYMVAKDTSGTITAYQDGDVAHGQIWARAISGVEVNETMWKPEFVPLNRSVLNPLFGVDSPEIDLSGNGKTGTLTGTTESNEGPPVMFGDGLPL